MVDTPKKVKHVARSLERHVLASRERTWAALLEELDAPDDARATTVLSFEPPWRRCHRLEDPTGLELCEETFVLRDDGDECHVSWGVVIDPEPSPAGWAFLDETLARVDRLLDRVKAAAEA